MPTSSDSVLLCLLLKLHPGEAFFIAVLSLSDRMPRPPQSPWLLTERHSNMHLTVEVNVGLRQGPACLLVTCEAYSFSDKYFTAGWEKGGEKQEMRGENYFFLAAWLFSFCSTKSYCVARGQDEKCVSAERISFQRKPAPVHVLLKVMSLTQRNTACFPIVATVIVRDKRSW